MKKTALTQAIEKLDWGLTELDKAIQKHRSQGDEIHLHILNSVADAQKINTTDANSVAPTGKGTNVYNGLQWA